jgi:peptide/nickel transport system substrate-binding protein
MNVQPNPRHRRLAAAAAAVLLLVAALALAATASGESPSPAGTGAPAAEKLTLRLGWNESPLNLNPFVGYSNSYEVWMLNYDTLVGVGADGLPSKETGLAEDWQLSDDELVWTFEIREDVKWHDGTPLTARDVAFTFNYIIENELSISVYLKDVDRAVAVDDTTLEVYCTEPKANMLLTQVYIYILPEHIWSKIPPEKANSSFRNDPPIVGSGPFQAVEFEKDGYAKMVRIPGYWGGEPKLDEIIFQYYTNTDTMVQDLKNGTIDGAQVVPPEQFDRLADEPGITAIAYPLYNWEYIDVNCYEDPDSLGHPALTDPAFRRALAWAIDRQKCAELGWSGLADTGYGIFPKQGWPESFDPYYEPTGDDVIGFELDKARQLLDEAGYTDSDGDGIREYEGEPITLRLWSRQVSPQSQVQGKLIAGWLQEIGLDIDYSVVDEGALGDYVWNYEGDTYAPDYDLALWDFMGYIDPGDSAACFTTDQIENYNEMCWSNSEYDRLTEEQYREMDPARRVELLKQAQAVMYEEQPMIVIDYPSVLQAVNTAKWQGWAPYVGGSVWNNFLYRGSYLELEPKTAEATPDQESSSTVGIVVAVIAAAAAAGGLVVWLRARSRGRAIEE